RECIREIARNERPYFLGLQIIRVVITGAQDIRSEHDAALALRAETLPPRVAVHIAQRTGGSRAYGIAHAVIAGQIRTGLRGGDDVITGDGVIGSGQADVAHLATELLQT